MRTSPRAGSHLFHFIFRMDSLLAFQYSTPSLTPLRGIRYNALLFATATGVTTAVGGAIGTTGGMFAKNSLATC